MEPDQEFLDELFADQGGFETAYKKLVQQAQSLLVTYGGNSSARVILRQLDAEDLVHTAFKRFLEQESEDDVPAYYVLRKHIQNQVRSAAKSAKENQTVRADASEELTFHYENQSDANELDTMDRVTILDDGELCTKLMFRVRAEGKNDHEVDQLCEAIISGFRDFDDLREFANFDQKTFDAAWKRLIRRFRHVLSEAEGELKK